MTEGVRLEVGADRARLIDDRDGDGWIAADQLVHLEDWR